MSPSREGRQPWTFLVETDGSQLVLFLTKRTISPADLNQLIHATTSTLGLPTEPLSFSEEMMQKELIDNPSVNKSSAGPQIRCPSPWEPS